MISVNFAVFIAFLLNGFIIVAFISNLLDNKLFLKEEKKINLKKITCDTCGLSSLVGSPAIYWRCSTCESLNKAPG